MTVLFSRMTSFRVVIWLSVVQ